MTKILNNKIIGGIATIIIVAAIVTVFALQQDNDVAPPIIIQSKEKIGLVINSPVSQTSTQEELLFLKQVYQQAASTGIGRSNAYIFWNSLEPEKDQFSWDSSDIIMSFNKQNNLKVTLFFSVVNGPGLGPFPNWMGGQALTENLADDTVRVLDAILSRYDIIDNVILGAEVDTHLRNNPGGIENYKHFFNTLYPKIKEKHPDVNFGSSFALHNVLNRDLGDLVKELSLGDFVAFSYSPTDLLNEIEKNPIQAKSDLERITELVPEKKFAIFEISWSTSDFVGGNEIDQVEFIEYAFDFYRENESQIEFFTWYRQYDRPEGTCDPEEQQSLESKISVGGDSGFGSSEFVIERLGYYTCNAGLIDVNGILKQGWNEFTTQIRQ